MVEPKDLECTPESSSTLSGCLTPWVSLMLKVLHLQEVDCVLKSFSHFQMIRLRCMKMTSQMMVSSSHSTETDRAAVRTTMQSVSVFLFRELWRAAELRL